MPGQSHRDGLRHAGSHQVADGRPYFAAQEVRLDAHTTKNDTGRVFPFALMPDLETLLEEQRAEYKRLVARKRKISPFVFDAPSSWRSLVNVRTSEINREGL